MTDQSKLLPSTRGGVPVFILPDSKPSSTNCSVIPVAARSPARPPPNCFSPIWIRPFRKVPLVSTTDLAGISKPIPVTTPVQRPSLTMRPLTISCQKSILGWASNRLRHFLANNIRSLCALGLHIAGPLDLLSIRNWIIV